MHLETFSEGSSILHKLDPRVKFLCYSLFAIMVALSDGLRVPFNAVVFSLLLIIIARLSFLEVSKRIMVVNLFLLPLWVLVPMDTPGTVSVVIGPYRATVEGFYRVLSITLKTNGIVLGGIAMLGTTDLFCLAHGMVHLKVPRRLIYLSFIFLRYLTLLHEEYIRLRRAMAARGFRPRTDLHTYRTYGYLIGMLFVRSYERAERLYRAMLSRGFRGEFPLFRHFTLTWKDIIGAVVLVGATVGVYLLP